MKNEVPTGWYKVRGAIYDLSLRGQAQGMGEVVASSTGNHGAAVAYAAKLLGWRARIFLPEKNNPIKRNNIARLGAAIEERGTIDLADAFQAASQYAQKSGAYFLNDATDGDLPAGPGNTATEIVQQKPDLDTASRASGSYAFMRS